MTREEKKLLLKDLCARLPYKPFISLIFGGERLIGTLYAIYPEEDRAIVDNLSKPIALRNVRCGGFNVYEIRPYLRPMSSMTEEEWLKLKEWVFVSSNTEGKIYFDGLKNISAENTVKAIDYLISHHFDYRIVPSTGKSMIESGLALEAPEGMYKIE